MRMCPVAISWVHQLWCSLRSGHPICFFTTTIDTSVFSELAYLPTTDTGGDEHLLPNKPPLPPLSQSIPACTPQKRGSQR